MNQYHPKAHQELTDTRKAHVYSIRGTLDKGTFSVFVFDQMTRNEFEQQFTQENFPNLKLYDIAKTVVDSINTTMAGGPPMITCKEWNGMAFVTVLGGQIPTLALPPKGADQMQVMQLQQDAQQAAQQAQYQQQMQAQQSQMSMQQPQQPEPEVGQLNAANLQNLNEQNSQMGGYNGNAYNDSGVPQQGAYDNFQQQMADSYAAADEPQMGGGAQGYDMNQAPQGQQGQQPMGMNQMGQQGQYGSQQQMAQQGQPQMGFDPQQQQMMMNGQPQQQQQPQMGYDQQMMMQNGGYDMNGMQQQYGSNMNMNNGGGPMQPMADNGYGGQMNMDPNQQPMDANQFMDPNQNMQQGAPQQGGFDANPMGGYPNQVDPNNMNVNMAPQQGMDDNNNNNIAPQYEDQQMNQNGFDPQQQQQQPQQQQPQQQPQDLSMNQAPMNGNDNANNGDMMGAQTFNYQSMGFGHQMRD
eukprot:231512_1